MLDWMQRHKKWLVVTIWISVIAFVGAGFVGWGAYDFGKSDGAVAKVGNKEIQMNELQREYSSLYSQYSSILGENFNQELAKQFGLEQLAMQTLIQKYLLINFADEIGIMISDEEVAKTLLEIEAFKKDGKFDKEQYILALRQNKITPVEFEKSLKNDLIVEKLQNMFQVKNSSMELDDMSSLIFMKNNLEIAIVNPSDVSVNINDDELKIFWEKNKNNYLSPLSYDIEIYEMKPSENTVTNQELQDFYERTRLDYTYDDGKIKSFDEALEEVNIAFGLEQSKNDALRMYLSLRKGETSFQNTKNIKQNSSEMIKFQEELAALKNGEVSKPFIVDDNYVIIKLINTNHPVALDFDNAKEMAKKDFSAENRKIEMKNKAQSLLDNKSLIGVGYVSRESVENISGLRVDEASDFLNQLFNTKSSSGIIELNDKVVAYNIVNSQLGSASNSRNAAVSNTIFEIKSNELFSKLLESLEQKYKVISYMK